MNEPIGQFRAEVFAHNVQVNDFVFLNEEWYSVLAKKEIGKDEIGFTLARRANCADVLHPVMYGYDKLAKVIREPSVGMGATWTVYTDSHAMTVTKVSASGKTITLREDKAKRIDNNGMSDIQDYSYEPDPNGREIVATLRKCGTYYVQGSKPGRGNHVSLGYRSTYHDFSF